jgi:hypothetical protein
MPLKIAVLSLKSVKRLSGVQNDSPVMNTPGSLDSPVVNTPGVLAPPVVNTLLSLNSPVINTPGSRLFGVFRTSIRTGLQKNFMVTNRPGESRLLSVLIPASCSVRYR